jgi:hypothetical protein
VELLYAGMEAMLDCDPSIRASPSTAMPETCAWTSRSTRQGVFFDNETEAAI